MPALIAQRSSSMQNQRLKYELSSGLSFGLLLFMHGPVTMATNNFALQTPSYIAANEVSFILTSNHVE